jgi:hypothetical protein
MYAHICEYGEPVEIGGLQIHPGSLIHGDRNGVHCIPLSIASEIPKIATKILTEESEFKEFHRSLRSSGWRPWRSSSALGPSNKRQMAEPSSAVSPPTLHIPPLN